ncbi:hypothetical protein BV22DRAFT_988161, partial [Leucogyrophana mollusca]
FSAHSREDANLVDDTTHQFLLNTEQERAFRIVANHATMACPEQLRMYLGGMASTGKSQVIKALISFFQARNESHRMITLAPIGSAAALLGGCTYHSVLGIRTTVCSSSTSLARVRSRLEGVDYIFINKLSMI